MLGCLSDCSEGYEVKTDLRGGGLQMRQRMGLSISIERMRKKEQLRKVRE